MEENTTPNVAPVAPAPVQTPAPVQPVAPTPQPVAPKTETGFEKPVAQTESQAQAQSSQPKEDKQTGKIIRYPFLLMSVAILRILAFVIIIISVIAGFAQLFVSELPFFYRVGMMFLYMIMGLFQAILCWVMSEGIKVWLDTEEMVRTPEKEAEMRAVIAEMNK